MLLVIFQILCSPHAVCEKKDMNEIVMCVRLPTLPTILVVGKLYQELP